LTLYNSPTFGGTGQSKYLQLTSAYLAEQYAQSTANIITTNVQITINFWAATISPGIFDIFECFHSFGPGYPNPSTTTWSRYGGTSEYMSETNPGSQIYTGVATTSSFANLIITIGPTAFKCYVNGIAEGLNSHSLPAWASNSLIQLNGYPNGGYSRSGNYQFGLYEVYDSVFTDAEAIELYDSQSARFAGGPPPPPPPPPTPPPLSSPGPIGGRRFGGRFNG
jgi:hypothetical protein